MSIIGTVYEDVTTDVLGNIGMWQWLVMMGCTALMVPSTFNQYKDMFLLQAPADAACDAQEGVTNASLCSFTPATNTTELVCNKWHVKLFWLIWLKKTWLVFCDDKMKLLCTTVISRMGLMFGCVIFGLIADSFGRRTAIAIDLFAQLSLGLIIIFCDSQAWFQLLVFLKALFGAATIYIGLIICCEIASNGWRSRLTTITSIPRLLADTCMIPLANSFPNLETYNFIASLFVILLIILLRWIPESPQWLLFNRKIPKAEKLIYYAAKKNGIKICEEFKIRPVNHRAYNCLDEARAFASIFTTYNTKIIILVFLLFWVIASFQISYHYVKVFKDNHLENYLYVLFCSTIGLAALTALLSKKMLLRHLLLLNILLSGISSATKVLLGHITPIFSLIALASDVVVFLLLLNITPRLFAINVRATLLGCCHAIGQLGTTLSYLLFLFEPLDDIATAALDMSIMVVLITLCLVLPDVDGRELPDMIEDMDYYSELSKPLRWVTQKTNSPSKEEVEMRIYSFGSAGRELTHNHSEQRLPAQRIGIYTFWRRFVNNFRQIIKMRK